MLIKSSFQAKRWYRINSEKQRVAYMAARATKSASGCIYNDPPCYEMFFLQRHKYNFTFQQM